MSPGDLAVSLALLGCLAAFTWVLLDDAPLTIPNTPGEQISEAPDRPAEGARLRFVGSLLQHPSHKRADFAALYTPHRALLTEADTTVATLEFPVDPDEPIGPVPGTLQFNGSPTHLKALEQAGVDVLSIATDHAWDTGDIQATTQQISAAGMRPLAHGPLVLDVGGTRVALVAYTQTLQPRREDFRSGLVSASSNAASLIWAPDDLPVRALNFTDWTAEFQEYGRGVFRRDVQRARQAGAQLVVALPHWAPDFSSGPTKAMLRAADDLADAGFDAVIGTGSHSSQVVSDRSIPVAWSLGSFMSDFREPELRRPRVVDLIVDNGLIVGIETRVISR